MIPKKFDAIGKEDLELLLAEERTEDRTLDYKADLPDFSDKKKKRKFLALVSSFANTVGGDIIYGISEKRENGNNTGVPGEITGISTESPDQTILKLENIIRPSLQPAIVPSVQIKAINGFEKGPVIIIRVPQSATAPHMVWKDRVSQFYIRSSNSTNPMDVGEIRSAFALSDSMAERMKEFRAQRISQIIADDTPVALQPGPKMVLHFLPFTAFDIASRPDYSASVKKDGGKIEMYPVMGTNGRGRYNFDGFVSFGDFDETGTAYRAYSQVFRSGIVEICSHMLGGEIKGNLFISTRFERDIIDNTEKFITWASKMDISPPLFLLLTLVNVKGYGIDINNQGYGGAHTPIERDNLFLREVQLEHLSEEPKVFFRTVFDTIWQACGYDRSYNYNEKGEWIASRR